jgi:hypothetical protein
VIYSVKAGVYGTGHTEGIYFRDIEVVDASIGFHLDSGAGGTSISNCHTNTDTFGIQADRTCQLAIIGNLMYRLGGGHWSGIQLDASPECRIVGNYIYGGGPAPSATSTKNGVVFRSACIHCTVEGNVINDIETGILLLNGSRGCIVSGNRILNYSNVDILDQAEPGSNLCSANLSSHGEFPV